MIKYKGYGIKGFEFWMAYCIGLGIVFSSTIHNVIFLPIAVVLGLLILKWKLDKEIESLGVKENA